MFFLSFFNDTATTEIYTLSLHDALPIYWPERLARHFDRVVATVLLVMSAMAGIAGGPNSELTRWLTAVVIVTFVVIVLGAYVRLSHAGLGCPDWPGCYGQLTWPAESGEIEAANTAFPERPVDIGKAWKEMVHRYLAGFLVLLVVAINVVAWRGGASRRARSSKGS